MELVLVDFMDEVFGKGILDNARYNEDQMR